MRKPFAISAVAIQDYGTTLLQIGLLVCILLTCPTRGFASPNLTLRRAIPFEFPLQIPQDLPWHFEQFLALHPDGQRVAILIPKRPKIGPQRRTEETEPQREFRLAWIDLESGKQLQSFPLTFGVREQFGFSMSRDATALCAVANGEVLLLNSALQIVAREALQPTNPGEETLQPRTCFFSADTAEVFILFWCANGLWWNCPSAVALWNWNKDYTVSRFNSTYVADAILTAEDWVVIYSLEPGWAYRYKARTLSPQRGWQSLWEVSAQGEETAQLVATSQLLVRSERILTFPTDRLIRATPITPDLLEWFRRGPRVRDAANPDQEIGLGISGKILVWQRGTDEKATELSIRGKQLQWPTIVSDDERWLVTRAVRFTYLDQTRQPRWDDNRFVIFDLRKPKKPIYVSEKFGPEEAITGLAFTSDRKTLVVATSRRLLIYDVKDSPAQ